MKKRIIPIFTYKNNVLVKSVQFQNHRNINSIFPIVKLFNKRNIDEMIFLNLEENIDFLVLETFVNEVDYPITYGGALKDIETMKTIFKLGFDKVCLNSIVFTNFDVVKEASSIFGKQSIIICLDVKKQDDEYMCFYHNGKVNANVSITQQVDKIIENDCAGEILITDIGREGTFQCFNYDLYRSLEDKKMRILINGGGTFDQDNLIRAASLKNVFGLCFSSLFFFTQYVPNDIKKLLHSVNISVVNLKK